MASSSATSQNRSANSSETSDQNDNNNNNNQTIDIRKRKRMQSNRESARRSRQRKQKQLDDLTGEMSQLRNQNGQILSTMNVTTQLYVNIEAENSVLRAQMAELSNRLNSLNEIVRCLSSPPVINNATCVTSASSESDASFDLDFDDCFSMSSFSGGWGFQPILPESDAFMC